MSTRIEKDPLGEKAVPAEALYGIQTLRAAENFPISGLRPMPSFVDAMIWIKRPPALTHKETGRLEPKLADAIVQAKHPGPPPGINDFTSPKTMEANRPQFAAIGRTAATVGGSTEASARRYRSEAELKALLEPLGEVETGALDVTASYAGYDDFWHALDGQAYAAKITRA